MEAVWIGARKPLRMGSSDYQEWYALVEQRMAELIPSYEMRRLSLVRQSPMCMYQLPTDRPVQKARKNRALQKDDSDSD